ncbi:uncharacterized protein LOC110516860 [Oncorhynchus mykiss]|uniref:uncharacterized protein LOC110516860 n=1 Tax=Oncorhynchus mykiss TaxID=8022 RepID=UPI0018783798|nr:uncharacterized protein LOC110516860 [Oncorhynchus mykiss]
MSGNLWTEEQFNCPVCLDLPNEPVTIPCGHSYCMGCIKDYWSKDNPRSPGVYSCPQCRQTFCPKPSLSRNTMLAEAVEQLRKGALTTSARESIRSAHRANTMGRAKGSSRSGGVSRLPAMAVPCDMCHGAGDQRAAVKSCLVCMASYCEAHLKPHQTKAELKKHELIAPTGKLAQKICTEHKYLQEFYCRQCQIFVCWLCTSNQHKDHETTSTKAERTERQKELAEVQTENHQRLKEREGELKDMKKMLEATKRSADRVHDDTETVLSELQRSVERLQELVEGVMNQAGQEKVSEAQDVVNKLEAEISELKRRDKDMKEVFRCEDNIHFLETCESLCSPFECNDLSCVVANPEATFEPVREAILNLRERVEDMCNVELGKITKTVNDTTLFTLGDKAKKNGVQKTGGFRSLFSGLGSKTTTTNNNRPAAPTPTVSVAVRGPNSRGVGLRSQDVRSREEPRADRDRPRREEREPAREAAPRPSTRSSPTQRRKKPARNSPTQSRRETRRRSPSPTPSRREPASPSPTPSRREPASPSPTPSRREPASPSPTPSRREPARPSPTPSRRETPRPEPTTTPTPGAVTQATPASGAFSRMGSIASLFRSHRRATPAPGPVNNNTGGVDPWGMGALTESQPEVNTSLFLDPPTPDPIMNQMPAFPALREIDISSIQAPEPRSREEFLQYACTLTLDTRTAHRRLTLSESNTKATLQGARQPYPDCPQRFDGWTQVLCQAPLSAQRCYWEVDWRGRGSSMGVAYGALSRKGADARAGFGYNAQSWSLELSDTCCTAMHDNEKRDIPVTYSPRLGLFLDLNAGTLAFYSVAESMAHLHTFRANFTQPLYAAFGVGSGVGVGLDFALGQFSQTSDSIKICPM